MPTARLLIVGAGAIGGVLAAHLADLGAEVHVLTTNHEIAEALRAHGARLRGDALAGPIQLAGVHEALDRKLPPFETVFLATQPPQVEEAARSALPWLAAAGRMVVLQNGLCEERIARIAGAQRVVGAVVAWGASMVEPGLYDRTSAGGFSLGRLDGAVDAPLESLGTLLEAVGPVVISRNLPGLRWSKLAINCVISTLGTIGGDRLGALIRHRFVRRLALEIMTETVAVARAEGVRLEKVSGTFDLEWLALSPEELERAGSPSLVAKHTLLLAVGARYRRLRSSMLSAIERGRTPAVDFLNGEVVDRGVRHGVATPVNEAARALVWSLSRRERTASMDTLRWLHQTTRRPP